MIKIILFFFVIGFSIYYINTYFAESWYLQTLYSMPKMIGILIAIGAMMFPHDYDKLPDMMYSVYKNNM